MASLSVAFLLFVLIVTAVHACNFVILDLTEFTQLVFDSFDTSKLRNDLDCFSACGDRCTGVAWNEATKDCYVLTSQFQQNGTSAIILPVNNLVVFAREEFACGTQ
ncbi:hypothetical protein CAPTEDRAFT_207492, partial [Capitella teleta]